MCSLLCVNYISVFKITNTGMEKKRGHMGCDVLWWPIWKIQLTSFTKCFQRARCFTGVLSALQECHWVTQQPVLRGDEQVASSLLLLLLPWLSSWSHEALVPGQEVGCKVMVRDTSSFKNEEAKEEKERDLLKTNLLVKPHAFWPEVV